MKKWLCLALALLTLTVCVWAAAESTDWNYDLNYAILRGYNGAGGDVTVPAEIDGYTVDVIGVSVFSSEAITSLTLPETVLELRSNAVSGVRKHDERYSASEPGRHQPNELFQLQLA